MHVASSADEPQGIWNAGVQRLQAAVSRRRSTTAACTLLAALALLTAFATTRPLPHYVLVIDSGSTGTRIACYIWRERWRQVPLIHAVPASAASHKVPRRQAGHRRAYERVETEPGLDHYINSPKGLVEKAIFPLLDWAEEVVPRQRWGSTPIFLFGTAGLRKLPEEHQENVLGTVRHILAACPFRFKASWARIVSGESEGIYGWIALNYLTGFLAPHPLSASNAASMETDADSAKEALEEGRAVRAADEGLKTVGALDLGGSSLEVTFVPAKLTEENVKANVSILGVQYNLFTHAHHRFGLNDAFDRSVEILLQGPALRDADDNVWVDYSAGLRATNPKHAPPLKETAGKGQEGKQAHALKSGIRHSRSLGESSLEALPALNHPCLQTGYTKPYRRLVHESQEPRPARVQLIGKPNWRACEELAALVVNASAPCRQAPCALGTPQPFTEQPLYALTGFHVVYHFFGLPPSASLAELEAKGRRFCDTDFAAIAAGRGAEIHVETYCFRVPFVITLLRHGLGVSENQTRIGTGEEAWTLGAALAEGSKVGAGRGPKQRLLSRATTVSLCSGTFLLWTLFLAWTWWCTDFGESHMERKISGSVPDQGLPGQLYHTGGMLSMPLLPQMKPGSTLQGDQSVGGATAASPTAVIGGNFNSNIARLSQQTNQRKRVSSLENLQTLR